MEKLRKISTMFATALAILTVVVSVPASATDYTERYIPIHNPNIDDTDWSLSSSVSSDYCRRKYDATSIYVKNNTSYTVGISVYGRAQKYGSDQPVEGVSYSTTYLSMPGNCERQIRQRINENSYLYAHIYFGGTGGHGVWSPDSVGTYERIN